MTLPNITPEAWYSAKCEARQIELALEDAHTLETYDGLPRHVQMRREAAMESLQKLASELGYDLSPRLTIPGGYRLNDLHEATFVLTMTDTEVSEKCRQPVNIECCAHFCLESDEGIRHPHVLAFTVKINGKWEQVRPDELIYTFIEQAFVMDETWLLDCAGEIA